MALVTGNPCTCDLWRKSVVLSFALVKTLPVSLSRSDQEMRLVIFCVTIFIFETLNLCLCIGQSTGSNLCKIPCEKDRFDIGKDCVEAGNKCQCIAHCCWAFDCKLWKVFARCRKKCLVTEWNRFGSSKGPVKCDHFRCLDHYLLDWDLRDVDDKEHINCIQHCCYAFNCKRYSGYCREMCNK